METTSLKSASFRKTFAGIIAILMLAFVIIGSIIPVITFDRIDDKQFSDYNATAEEGQKLKLDWSGADGVYDVNVKQFITERKELSMNGYIWMCYAYPELSRDVLPNVWKDAKIEGKYNLTSSIGFPLFSFLAGIIGAVVVYFANKFYWNVGFSTVFGLGSLIGMFVNPVLKLFNPTANLISIIIAALVLALSVAYIFMISVPLFKHYLATREKY